MKPTTQRLAIVFSVLSSIALTASAQNNRSFVSTSGSDANTCTPGNECRSFTRAMAVTNAGGEIIAISSGGYGAFMISNAVTVTGAPGVAAAITVTTGHGIDIIAGTSDRVVLRNLNLIVTPSANAGIYANVFGALSIENCAVTGGTYGIFSAGPSGSLTTVSGTTVRGSFYGVFLASHAAVSHCRIETTTSFGLTAIDGTSADGVVSASDLTIAGSGTGVYAFSGTMNHNVAVDLDRVTISGASASGIFADGAGAGAVVVRVSNSTVVENASYGLSQTGTATLGSLNNNLVAGNVLGDTNGSISPITVH